MYIMRRMYDRLSGKLPERRDNSETKQQGSKMRNKAIIYVLGLFLPLLIYSHHYKGLPHYSYFEHYPQIPVEEFLGQAGEYEMSLVIYDFQGFSKKDVEQPDDVRLYLIIFNLQKNKVYNGRVLLEIMNGDQVIHSIEQEKAAEENVYHTNRKIPEGGNYSLRVTLKDENNISSVIPFQLSSQKTSWGKWIALGLFILVSVAAYGSRKKRIMLDRKENKGNRG